MSDWCAIESNPEVFTALMRSLGVPANWAVHDVYSFDADLLAMVPTPVLALNMVFSTSAKEGEVYQPPSGGEPVSGPFYLEQVQGLPNACGTIALIHSVANNLAALGVPDDALVARFVADTRNATRSEIGAALANHQAIRDLHNSFVAQGQSRVLSNDDDVTNHFLSLVAWNGRVVELDGALRQAPIDRGAINEGESFLQAAARIIQRDWISGTDAITFAVTAIAPAQADD